MYRRKTYSHSPAVARWTAQTNARFGRLLQLMPGSTENIILTGPGAHAGPD